MGERGKAVWLAAFAIGGVGLTSCAALQRAGDVRCPAEDGAPWVELRSEHFVVRTDRGAGKARRLIDQFERTHATLAELAFAGPARPATADVVLFASEEEFAHFRSRDNVAGYFTLVDGRGTIVMPGDLVEETRRLFQHELTHLFVRARLGRAPVWLNEGLAMYFETARIEEDKVVLGGLHPCIGFLGATRHTTLSDSSLCPVRAFVSIGRVPKVAALRAMDAPAFYREGEAGPNYAGSWALVHLLRNGPEPLRRRFASYLTRLGAGDDDDAAWGAGFGDLPARELDRALGAWLLRDDNPEWQVTYQPPPPAPLAGERVLPPEAVHLLWADLRPVSAEGLAAAEGDLAEARAHGEGVDVERAAVRVYSRQGQRAAALRSVLKALDYLPDDEVLLYRAVTLLAGEHGGAPPERFEELFARLRRRARAAEALNAVAWIHAGRKQADEGIPFAIRALERQPGCWECVDTLALLVFEKGDAAQALDLQRRAIALAPHGRVPADVRQRLQQYQDASRKQPAAAKE